MRREYRVDNRNISSLTGILRKAVLNKDVKIRVDGTDIRSNLVVIGVDGRLAGENKHIDVLVHNADTKECEYKLQIKYGTNLGFDYNMIDLHDVFNVATGKLHSIQFEVNENTNSYVQYDNMLMERFTRVM